MNNSYNGDLFWSQSTRTSAHSCVIVLGLSVIVVVFLVLATFTMAACDWKSQRTLKTVMTNVIGITGKQYIMHISKHDGNSC